MWLGGISLAGALLGTSVRDELAACNAATAAHGLSLTEEQAAGLTARRREALAATGRVEFGRGVLRDIAQAFCDSSYVRQETYEETLAAVQDTFYRRKEQAEACGGMADDELIEALRAAFDGQANGSLDALDDISLPALQQWAKQKQAGDYDETTQREAEEEQDFDEYEPLRDELDRVYETGHDQRPSNEFAASYYDGYNELYRVGFDANSRIGGSSLS